MGDSEKVDLCTSQPAMLGWQRTCLRTVPLLRSRTRSHFCLDQFLSKGFIAALLHGRVSLAQSSTRDAEPFLGHHASHYGGEKCLKSKCTST